MTRHIYRAAALAAALATMAVTGGPAAAHLRHRRPTAAAAAPAPAAPPFSFYPESIEGGVTGNLPFNNQLRKLSDPLNANGGR